MESARIGAIFGSTASRDFRLVCMEVWLPANLFCCSLLSVFLVHRYLYRQKFAPNVKKLLRLPGIAIAPINTTFALLCDADCLKAAAT